MLDNLHVGGARSQLKGTFPHFPHTPFIPDNNKKDDKVPETPGLMFSGSGGRKSQKEAPCRLTFQPLESTCPHKYLQYELFHELCGESLLSFTGCQRNGRNPQSWVRFRADSNPRPGNKSSDARFNAQPPEEGCPEGRPGMSVSGRAAAASSWYNRVVLPERSPCSINVR